MTIEIKRFYQKDEVLDGILKIGDEVICETSENVETAVPDGEYPLTLMHCRQYDRLMLVIGSGGPDRPYCHSDLLEVIGEHEYKDVLTRCDLCKVRTGGAGANTVLPQMCPMLKMGNGVIGRKDGSICIGKHPRDEFGRVLHGVLLHSTETLDRLVERIRRIEDCRLKIESV